MADEGFDPAERKLALKLAAAVFGLILFGFLGAIFIGLEVPLYIALALTPCFIGYLVFMAATPDPGD